MGKVLAANGILYERTDPALKQLYPQLYGDAKPLPKTQNSEKKPKVNSGGCASC